MASQARAGLPASVIIAAPCKTAGAAAPRLMNTKRLCALGALLAFALSAAAAEPGEQRPAEVMAQLQRVAVTPEQADAFGAAMKAYFDQRRGLFRRLERQGGDMDVRAPRELRRLSASATQAMSKILTPEQMPRFSAYLRLENERYLARAALR